MLPLVGDGLLPADIDGKQKPKTDTAIPIVGTQDDDGRYGATFDALNIWDLTVKWGSTPTASLVLNTQLRRRRSTRSSRARPTARDCLPQPGITDPLSTSTSCPTGSGRPGGSPTGTSRITRRWSRTSRSRRRRASPACAGTRSGGPAATYSLYQQGTYAPSDGVHRWMGSIAMDKKGNMGLGYSVVNGTSVFPGIRYTGRLAGDPPGR